MKKPEHLILLHGLSRTNTSMKVMELFFESKNYKTHNINYPSRKETIENLSKKFLKPVIKSIPQNETIHFITHSMGGMITRYFLSQNPLPNLGRVVTMTPPNQGSLYVDQFRKFDQIAKILGPGFLQMGTTPDGIAHQLPEPDYELGIIAGRFDHKTPVESTKLKNATDFLIINTTHSFIMYYPEAMKAAHNFFQTGKFNPKDNTPNPVSYYENKDGFGIRSPQGLDTDQIIETIKKLP